MKWLIVSHLILIFSVATANDKKVTIASKAFSESIILSEMLSIILEENFGFAVNRKMNLGGTQITFDALKGNSIDLYPDYTGTGYSMILKREGLTDADKIYQVVKDEFDTKYQIAWSRPLGFNNTYALAVKRDDKRFHNINTISELSSTINQFKLAAPHEFMERKDGFRSFVSHYHLDINNDKIATLSSGLMYSAIQDRQVDIIMSYSTDGRIPSFNLKLLKDDLSFFPPYQAAFLIRKEILKLYPEISKALKFMEGSILESDIIKLNNEVDQKKIKPYQAAYQYLVEKNVVEPKKFIHNNQAYFIKISIEHIKLSLLALILATIISVPTGILMARNKKLANYLFPVINTIQTIPSLALLGFLIPLFGIGFYSAIIALFLYALLPLIRNTYAGLQGIDPSFVETAKAIGLTERQVLYKIEIPLAMPVILSGLRTATAIIIGTATLAALVGAGGYGDPIFRGIATVNNELILLGAIPSALLAIIIDKILGYSERWLVSPGLRR